MKRIIAAFAAAMLMAFSLVSVGAEELGGSELGTRQESFVPQETSSPQSTVPVKDEFFQLDSKGYVLFYTQTTVLALIAGYLILFKVKGIPKHEKMHKLR